MKFFSDNAAPVHPKVWDALKSADALDSAYDGDALSKRMDAAFSALFQQDCASLWVATGTAANALALATMVAPYSGIVCHKDAHIEVDEGGAPGFFTHGAKLMLVEGEDTKLTPQSIADLLAPIRRDVHQVWPQAISITQANEAGRSYTPAEILALGTFARQHDMRLHMDGARFANAVAYLGCDPAAVTCRAGVSALSFGFIKNGAMNAEALIFFEPDLAERARHYRKRSGHLQSKGRYLAAQILALLEGDLWLTNAKAANAAAQEIGAAAAGRLLYPVEANEAFVRITSAEAAALRAQGFEFYDWPAPGGQDETARFVTAWDSDPHQVAALAKAIRAL